MSRRSHPQSTPDAGLRVFLRFIPWKLLLLLPILVLIAIPTYMYGSRFGGQVIPSLTGLFYTLSAPSAGATPTPLPAFPTLLPQVGPVLYTVQEGDSCDSILTFQMRMADAGQVFSDVKPETVKALNEAVGKDCHTIQPGMVLPLSPHYPLTAMGGVVLKIQATTAQQVLPTPLINVTRQVEQSVDCSDGCLLTVQVAPTVQVHMLIQTGLPIRVGSWVWAQFMLARKDVPGFANYPYVDPTASLDGSQVRACDLQVDNTHDDNALPCDQLLPNTIDDDGGSWLVGVTGLGGLDHWRYPIHQPPGTHVLLWLTADKHGSLSFHPGNPVYHYNDTTHVYERV